MERFCNHSCEGYLISHHRCTIGFCEGIYKNNLLADSAIHWPNPLRLMCRCHHDEIFYIESALDHTPF